MGHYVFIDGNYLMEAFNGMMQTFYGTLPALNYRELQSQLGGVRVYYYDAVDRNAIHNETPAQRDARVKERDDLHAYLNSLPTWHVREGFVSRGRRASRRTQKGG